MELSLLNILKYIHVEKWVKSKKWDDNYQIITMSEPEF